MTFLFNDTFAKENIWQNYVSSKNKYKRQLSLQEKSPAKHILGKAQTPSSNELPAAFRRKNISFWSYLFYHYTISACQYSLWQQFQQFYVIPSVQINNKRLTYIQSEKRRKKIFVNQNWLVTDLLCCFPRG